MADCFVVFSGFGGRCSITPVMPLIIQVGLLSGRSVSLEAFQDESVDELKRRAQRTLAVGRGRLLNSSGELLDGAATLEESRLQSGDRLTLQLSRVHVCGNDAAFAAILGDGSVVTWGNSSCGGGSAVLDRQQIQATSESLTCGDAEHCRNSSAVQHQLKDAQQIQATACAFAAILGDRSVATLTQPIVEL